MSPRCRRVGLLCLIAVVTTAHAFVVDGGPYWTKAVVNLSLRLGSSPSYTDSSNPNSTAAEAAKLWNPYMGRLQLSTTATGAGSGRKSDGTNDVFFANDVYGTAFGSDVLAVTLIQMNSTERVETDVLVNKSEAWDSYRGALQGAKTDLRRVLAHEFGHVLGVDHPDENGQGQDALMNSYVGDIEMPMTDDQDGVSSLYGRGTGNPALLPVLFDSTPYDVDAIVGSNISLEVFVAAGTAPFTYQWQKNGVSIAGANLSSLPVANAQLMDAGDYRCVVTNEAGSVTSRIAKLTVSLAEKPSIVTSTEPVYVTEGSRTTVYARVDGTYPIALQWSRNGTPLLGQTAAELYISNARAEDEGEYALTATNSAGTTISTPFKLVVLPLPVPAQVALRVSASSSTRASIDVSDPGDGPFSYQWYKNGVVIDGATTSSLNLENVRPEDAGDYMVVITNASGSTPSRAVVFYPPAASYPEVQTWTSASRQGDIAYFLFSDRARIEGYDLAAGAWNAAVTLSRTPTAFCPVAGGFYVAFGKTVVRISTDGTNERTVYTSDADVTELMAAADYVYAIVPTSAASRIVTLRIADDAHVATYSSTWGISVTGSAAITPTHNLIFGTATMALQKLALNADGTFGSLTNASLEYPSRVGKHTYVSPDASRVYNSGGRVYRSADLGYIGALPGAYEDLAFTGDGGLVTLRGSQLFRYDAQHHETGRYLLQAAATKLFLFGETAVLFNPARTSGGPVSVQRVSLSAFTTRAASPVVGPEGLAYVPSGVFLGAGNVVYLYSRLHACVFRWSVHERKYLSSIALKERPDLVTYSGETDSLYFVDGDRRITRAKSGEDEVEMAVASSEVLSIAAAGQYLFLNDMMEPTTSFWTYGSDGTVVATSHLRSPAADFVWSPANRRLYYETAFLGPSELRYTAIAEEGKIAPSVESGDRRQFPRSYPLRVSPSGDALLIGTGELINAETLVASRSALANSFDDAAWLGGRIYTARGTIGGVQLQRWGGGNYSQDAVRTISGRLLRLFAIGDSQLLIVVMRNGAPNFVVLDADLGGGDVVPPPEPAGKQRLINLSSRGVAGAGDKTMIAGFVVRGSGNKDVLIRAAGPSLARMGVAGVLPNPRLVLFKGKTSIATNDDWDLDPRATEISNAAHRVGAFGFDAGAKDAAILTSLEPGVYTAHVTSDSSVGVAMVEVYDAGSTTATAPKLVNISSRAEVGTGDNLLIAGLVIAGDAPKKVLLRGVGPALGGLGVSGALQRPLLRLFKGTKMLKENQGWDVGDDAALITAAAKQVGAFSLPAGSNDTALLVSLSPGAYTVHLAGVGSTTGVALIEAYEVPD